MKSGTVFAFLAAFLSVWSAARAADDPKLAQLKAEHIYLAPTDEITLYVGEKFSFYVGNRDTNKYMDPATLLWQINGQPLKDAGPDDGTLTSAVAADGPNMVYRAPMKRPAKPITISVLPASDPTGQPRTATVIVTDQKNWIELDGDLPKGHEEMTIVPSSASGGTSFNGGRFRLTRMMGFNAFAVEISGVNKDDPTKSVSMLLNMGPHGSAGTYGWTSSERSVGVSVEVDDTHFGSTSIYDRPPHSLTGSTTILPPRPIDPPGTMRGSFSGQLVYLGNGKDTSRHFVTVHGHFSVAQKY